MNMQIRSLSMAALVMAASAAYADARISVDINPFGWGEAPPPPLVYAPPRDYAPPPVVYYGGGRYWGDRREGREGRDHGHDGGRADHHDGDRRR